VGAPGSNIGKGATSDVGDPGKQSRGRGLLARSAMPGSRVEGGGALAIDFGSLMTYYVKSSGF
jgi:hypothetical protein